MNIVNYITGRNYGADQVLSITFETTQDWIADVPAAFVDAARGIRASVIVLGFEATPNDIGAAVMREYDAGRYTLA